MEGMLVEGVIVVLVALVTFEPSLNNGFAYDDHIAVKKNPDVVGNSTLAEAFFHDFWGQNMSSTWSHKSVCAPSVDGF